MGDRDHPFSVESRVQMILFRGSWLEILVVVMLNSLPIKALASLFGHVGSAHSHLGHVEVLAVLDAPALPQCSSPQRVVTPRAKSREPPKRRLFLTLHTFAKV